jgi:DHA1 family tetracycline resistance protein-like MFS transporter
MNAPSAPGPRRAAFLFVFITELLDMLAVGIIIPVLPRLVVDFMGGDTVRGAEIYGVFGTAWALMQFLFSPVQGSLSDRFGRRPVILLSNLGLGLDYLVMALAPGWQWLFIGRVISGIASASVSTAGAYIADVTLPEKRAGAFGMLGAAFGIGFILGPGLGGLLGSVDPRLPFWVAAGLSLVNFAYGFFVLPESLPRERRSPFRWRQANPLGALRLLASHPRLLSFASVYFLNSLAHVVLPSTFVLYAGYRYHWGTLEVGATLAGVGVATLIVQAGIIRPFVARYGERTALYTGLLFGTAGFALSGLAPTGTIYAFSIPLLALWGLANPSAQGLMTRLVDPTEQGRLQGSLSSVQGIASMIGPGLFTQIFARFIDPAGPHLPGMPFLLASLLLVVALVVAVRIVRTAADLLGPRRRPA